MTGIRFGAEPGHRPPPTEFGDRCRVHGELKKINLQPGKIEIVFMSEDVDAYTVSRIAELQQLGAVYIEFEQAPDVSDTPPPEPEAEAQ
jgi:hypothetical protein